MAATRASVSAVILRSRSKKMFANSARFHWQCNDTMILFDIQLMLMYSQVIRERKLEHKERKSRETETLKASEDDSSGISFFSELQGNFSIPVDNFRETTSCFLGSSNRIFEGWATAQRYRHPRRSWYLYVRGLSIWKLFLYTVPNWNLSFFIQTGSWHNSRCYRLVPFVNRITSRGSGTNDRRWMNSWMFTVNMQMFTRNEFKRNLSGYSATPTTQLPLLIWMN